MNLQKFTKKKLEEIGRKFGIELDRRYTKDTLVDQLETVLPDLDVLEEDVITEEQEIYLTQVTKPVKSRSRYFTDASGNVLKFKNKNDAIISGKRFGGRATNKNNYYVVIKH